MYIVEDDGDGTVRRRNVVLNEADKTTDYNSEYKGWIVDIEGKIIDVYGAFVSFSIGDDGYASSAYDGLSIVAPNFERLDCYGNNLTSLDMSKNVALTYLHCSTNQLTSLDVSKNVALTDFDCSTNQLTSLDVSKNVNLTELYCSTNQLTSLDVSKNVNLTGLYCTGNPTVTTLSIASEYGNESVSTELETIITSATSTTGTLNIYGGDNTTVHTAATTKGWTVNTNL